MTKSPNFYFLFFLSTPTKTTDPNCVAAAGVASRQISQMLTSAAGRQQLSVCHSPPPVILHHVVSCHASVTVVDVDDTLMLLLVAIAHDVCSFFVHLSDLLQFMQTS